jgi:periplasmic protein TonB
LKFIKKKQYLQQIKFFNNKNKFRIMKNLKLLPIAVVVALMTLVACKNDRKAAAEAAAIEAKNAADLASQLEAQRADSLAQANEAAAAAESEKLAAEEAAAAAAAKKGTKTVAAAPKPAAKPKPAPKPAPKPKPTTKPAKTPPPPADINTQGETTLLGGTADQFDNSSNVIHRNGKDDVLTISDIKPSYIGGDAAMMKYLSKNIKYPAIARENGIKGTVFVKFVVEKNGTVSEVSVAKGVDPSLDAEAKRVVSSMPKWTPGKQAGQAVAVQYTLPVKFQLVD